MNGVLHATGNNIGFLNAVNEGVWILQSTPTTTYAPNFTLSSDVRLKRDMRVINDALAAIEQLSGYTFSFQHEPDVRRVGVSAQDVLRVLPEAVDVRNDGTLGVSYDNLVPLLIQGMKELHAKVRRLEAQLAYG
jgi:hypothetical protein